MRNFQDTFATRKRSFISAFSICMTIPLKTILQEHKNQCVELILPMCEKFLLKTVI